MEDIFDVGLINEEKNESQIHPIVCTFIGLFALDIFLNFDHNPSSIEPLIGNISGYITYQNTNPIKMIVSFSAISPSRYVNRYWFFYKFYYYFTDPFIAHVLFL